ncbi:probable extracellular repeat, HAF family [Arsukibacterium tuosuense]|uniref:Probable extracellular repeat, HAF family n=1 Tax=Arsukibacterium tuosuense TaxID=1323745 RepID=A0A285I569_9GAMM|nr:DUF3466 family protein [Arsukibacterium tuosuense]SNY43162.1 probable extracellular repeat, HAF family [Arsukibacterium tuosuense]
MKYYFSVILIIAAQTCFSESLYRVEKIAQCTRNNSHAYAINNSGVITGSCGNKIFIAKGADYDIFPSLLSSPLYGTLQPTAINDNGVIIGFHRYGAKTKAFKYIDGEFQELYIDSSAYGALDINNNNEIVGWLDKGGNHDSFISNGQSTVLKLSDISSHISAINDSSVSTGEVWLRNHDRQGNYRRAYILKSEELTLIPTLGGVNSWGEDINNNGVIVGSSETEDGAVQAFYYNDEEGTKPINIHDAKVSHATAINDNNEIVGWYKTFQRESYIFLYKNGEVNSLNRHFQEGIKPYLPHDINNEGVIVGVALEGRMHVPFVIYPNF